MVRHLPQYLLALVVVLAGSGTVHAIQRCELNGQPVNPNNGATTESKTGLMRCRDEETGAVVREQELKAGRFVGVVRVFKAGQVEKEYSVNERGNVDGLSREWNVDAATGKRVLVREETMRNSSNVGIARTWWPTGQRRRLTFYGDDGREEAAVEFNDDGTLASLRCASLPVFASDFDDRAACGFAGSPSTVALYNARGRMTSRLTLERGERRRSETVWESGAPRDVRETLPTGGSERSFAADGTLRHEVRWVTIAAKESTKEASSRPRSFNVLDQEFHESGKLMHERRWAAPDGADRGPELASETWWYLNGQMKSQDRYEVDAGARLRRQTTYFDDGRAASEGTWRLADVRGGGGGSGGGPGGSDRYGVPTGTHRSFDEQGRVSSELAYDDRGRLTREKRYEDGRLVRDDEVYEDGSRKAMGR